MRWFFILVLFPSLALADVVGTIGLDDPFESTKLRLGTGEPFYLNYPTNTTYCVDNVGTLECHAGGDKYSYDGSDFRIGTGAKNLWLENNQQLRLTTSGNDQIYSNGVAILFVKTGGTVAFLTTTIFDLSVGLDVAGDTLLRGKRSAVTGATQSLLAASQINPNSEVVHIVGNGGAVTLTSNPQILAGANDQFITIVGTDDTNHVTLVDGSGLQLNGTTSFTLKSGYVIELLYSSVLSVWVERSRSANGT